MRLGPCRPETSAGLGPRHACCSHGRSRPAKQPAASPDALPRHRSRARAPPPVLDRPRVALAVALCSAPRGARRPQPDSGEPDRRRGDPPSGGDHVLADRLVPPLSPQPAAGQARRRASGPRLEARHRLPETVLASGTARTRRRSPTSSWRDNARQYFELFTRARLLMPLFSVIGGLVVFAWSRRLYGDAGGLLSLALWSSARTSWRTRRLVTTDMAATALGVLATFVFWLYLKRPVVAARRARRVLPGAGAAHEVQHARALWAMAAARGRPAHRGRRIPPARRSVSPDRASSMVAMSVLVIDLGYGFEGVGIPLGRYEFVCQTLDQARRRPECAGRTSPDPLRNGGLPLPGQSVPRHRLGVSPCLCPNITCSASTTRRSRPRASPRSSFPLSPEAPRGTRSQGYPVYLDGTLAAEELVVLLPAALVYKVPEGTWLLVLARSPSGVLDAVASGVVRRVRRAGGPGVRPVRDERLHEHQPGAALRPADLPVRLRFGRQARPLGLGLREAAGKGAAWGAVGAAWRRRPPRRLSIHPHYLAYFNAVSGGPDRGAEHLIDSNLDWGQDLVNLRRWLARTPRASGSVWRTSGRSTLGSSRHGARGSTGSFPPRAGDDGDRCRRVIGSTRRSAEPGLYAVSASLAEGLPGGSTTALAGPRRARLGAAPDLVPRLQLLPRLTPIDKVGHSIWIYRVTPEDGEASHRLARDRAFEGPGTTRPTK